MDTTTTNDINCKRSLSIEGDSMGIKQLPDGKWEVSVSYRDGYGVPRHSSKIICNTVSDAIAAETALKSVAVHATVKQEDIEPQPRSLKITECKTTLAHCVDLYCEYKKEKGNPCDYHYSTLRTEYGDYKVSALKQVIRHIDQRTDISPATQNRRKAYLRAALNYAIDDGLIDGYPIKKWRLKKETGRDVVLNEVEEKRLFGVLKSHHEGLYLACLFARYNPIRKADLLSLKIGNLDLEEGKVFFRAGKTGNGTVLIAWMGGLKEYFWSLKGKDKNLPLFGFPNDFRREWEKCRTLAGVAHFNFHDFRHMACAYLLGNGGMHGHDLVRMGIWSSAVMIARYNGTTCTELRDKFIRNVLANADTGS